MAQLATEAPGHEFEAVRFQVTLVSESGVTAVPMGEGEAPVVCRRQFPGAFVNLDAEDGLRAEMRRELRPVPWHSRDERDAAAAAVRADLWLEGADRDAIVGHIEGTPFYEWD